jgi:hypothetical protein
MESQEKKRVVRENVCEEATPFTGQAGESRNPTGIIFSCQLIISPPNSYLIG